MDIIIDGEVPEGGEKAIQNFKMSGDYNIKVVCRLRPLNKIEIGHGGECCVKFSDNSIQIAVGGDQNKYEFGFDKIFAPDTRQVMIYEQVAKPILNAVFTGFNGTVFAYGQTGGGKTWTMQGPNHDDVQLKGLIPRMMEGLFQKIQSFDEAFQFTIKCSYIEIYNEKIMDLLDPSKNKLEIKEDKQRGIFIQDCTQIYVASVAEMRNTMKNGSQNRRVAFTGMNQRSSRSHSIFIVHIGQKDVKKGSTKSAKLYFVDLAGSEKVSKTGVSGQQLQQAKNINKSLSCLGNVINALTSEKKEHVPYRDSKLTRILQESIGGNSRTTLIINCSMCSYNDKQTLSTLRFGYRAKSIKNKPLVNEEKSAKELQILLDQAKKTIQQLTQQLKMGGKLPSVPQQVPILSSQQRQKLESRIQQLQEQLQDKMQLVENSAMMQQMENRIKQLVIQNNGLVVKYSVDMERLQQQNKRYVQTIQSLFTKQATLQKLLNRLKTDLNYLKLNLKYEQVKTEEMQSQTKSIESIDIILKDIIDFADFLTVTNQKLTKQQQVNRQQNSKSLQKKKAKYQTSLSEPNLHDAKVVKNFQEISCIIKQKLNEDSSISEDNKQEQNSTEIQTLINEFNKQNEQKNKTAISELTRENGAQQKLIQELKVKFEEAANEFKQKQKKMQEFYEDVLKRANTKLQEINIALVALQITQKVQTDDMKCLQQQLALVNKEYNDQKTLSQKLLKIIQGNHDMSERMKMEQKSKEYASQRQKLFNELYVLREKLDDAEIDIKEKDQLITSLKSVMKSSYQAPKYQPIVRVPTSPEVIRKSYNQNILGVESKNVVKTIKGGGKVAQHTPSIVQEIKKSTLRGKLGVTQQKKPGMFDSFKSLFS